MGRDGGRKELAPVRKLPVSLCRGWGHTERLVPLLFRISPSPSGREMDVKPKALQFSPSALTAAAPDAGCAGAEYSLRMHPAAKRRSEEQSGGSQAAVLCLYRCCFHQHCVYHFPS